MIAVDKTKGVRLVTEPRAIPGYVPGHSQRFRSERPERPERVPAEEVDIRILIDGTVAILWGRSDVGVAWLAENLDPDALRFGEGYACEIRYIQPIIEGLIADGLVLGSASGS